MTVMFKPLAGILPHIINIIPHRFVPLTRELSFVDKLTEPIIYPGSEPTNPATPGAFSTNLTSTL